MSDGSAVCQCRQVGSSWNWNLVYTIQPVVKPRCTTGLTTGCIHDTAGCQRGLTSGWMFVYIHDTTDTTGCETGCRFDNRFDNLFDNRLYRVNGAWVWGCTAYCCNRSSMTSVHRRQSIVSQNRALGETVQSTEKLDVCPPLYRFEFGLRDMTQLRAVESMEKRLTCTDRSNWWSTESKAALRCNRTRRDNTITLSTEWTRSL